MAQAKTQIFNDQEVRKTLKRLAFQVYERNYEEKEIVVAGIHGRGATIAHLLIEGLKDISKLKIHFTEIMINKKNPLEVNLSTSLNLEGKCVVVVDDVLNTGKTFMYALRPFMETTPKKIQTLVLVDRNHKSFPVSADYIGISLSTTLQEHVEVSIGKEKMNVYLT